MTLRSNMHGDSKQVAQSIRWTKAPVGWKHQKSMLSSMTTKYLGHHLHVLFRGVVLG